MSKESIKTFFVSDVSLLSTFYLTTSFNSIMHLWYFNYLLCTRIMFLKNVLSKRCLWVWLWVVVVELYIINLGNCVSNFSNCRRRSFISPWHVYAIWKVTRGHLLLVTAVPMHRHIFNALRRISDTSTYIQITYILFDMQFTSLVSTETHFKVT